jgi:predicted DCC family thiol-disulfide oxidoreductase YuxK
MEPKDQEEQRLPMQACLLIYDGNCRFCVSVKVGLERRGVDQITTGIGFDAYQSEVARIAGG